MFTEIAGKVKKIEEVQTRNWQDKVIKTQNIILETQGWKDKSMDVCLEINVDSLNLSQIALGDYINFKATIESKQYNNKWFNNIRGFQILDHKQSQSQPQQPQSYVQIAQPVQQPQPVQQQQINESDLPF